MNYPASVLIGCLLGSINAAYFLSKANGFDIRDKGTHNPGASNMKVTLGWSYGIATAIFDILKASVALLICQWLFPTDVYAGLVGGIACVMGHMYPVFLKFRGGKGFASYMGMLLAVDWKIALVFIAVDILITLVSNYIALATIFTVIAYPIYYYLTNGQTPMLYALIALGLVIIYRHRQNIINIATGKEIGLRSVGKKDKQ